MSLENLKGLNNLLELFENDNFIESINEKVNLTIKYIMKKIKEFENKLDTILDELNKIKNGDRNV